MTTTGVIMAHALHLDDASRGNARTGDARKDDAGNADALGGTGLSALIAAAVTGALDDPFGFFGPHRLASRTVIRSFQPGARLVELVARDDGRVLATAACLHPAGLFEAAVEGDMPPYLLRIHWEGAVQETEDPYSFGLLLGDIDLHLFSEGSHRHLGDVLGAQVMSVEDVPGTRFAVWAPNAKRVAVVGDFNSWDGRRHPMRLRHSAGLWEVFVPRLSIGACYKYEIVANSGVTLPLKADPVALYAELPPATGSVVAALEDYDWGDDAWMARRGKRQAAQSPISIYEVHSASWWRRGDQLPNWHDLIDRLIPYVAEMGFTHIEFMPVTEHPFAGSWGYQPLGLFAPTARHGTIDDFRSFVDACHRAGIGIILDWVPGHFPNDAHGLAAFDGTHLYEHQDPREGLHQDWDTLIYNYGRAEVREFLIASALHWLRHYHIDGLRVDAVASMLYRDYSRDPGDWIPNHHGGRENLEAIHFLRELTQTVHADFPGTLMIAEESTAWPGVTHRDTPLALGFDGKWNMGWMNDSLRYMARDPVHRRHHHHDMTFSLVYAFSERFVLPLSHDEVVHGKGSIIDRMPGDDWQKRAGLRAYLAFMWTHPGRKLLFMGTEFGQQREWNHDRQLDWHLLDLPAHQQLQVFVRELNRLYRDRAALHRLDDRPEGFQWLIGDDAGQSVYAYLRKSDRPGDKPLLVICNFTPVPRHDYRVGVPVAGPWREILNSDSIFFGGSNLGNDGTVATDNLPAHQHGVSLRLTIPPLATLILEPGNL